MPQSLSSKCPRCGTEYSTDAPEGLCPRCLAAVSLDPESALGEEAKVAAVALLKPEELAPHFPQLEILECLGRGGMGVVYKARQKSLNRLVALKLLAPERAKDEAFARRFTREAHALAALNHPHIVTIYDFGTAGGFYYLLMEFVDGVNLRQAMGANRFTPEQALAVVPPICEALEYAHTHGVVHRDIKPENLLLDREGRVKIADFGIARILGDDSTTGLAETQPAGTPQYMAPEQKERQRTDHRADIYSLGVVLYEMLTGELPANKLQPPSSVAREMRIDVRLDEIVLRALEKTPELRFQTATELRTKVEAMVAGGGPVNGAAPPSSSTPLSATQRLFRRLGFRHPLGQRFLVLSLLTFLGFFGRLPGWEGMLHFFWCFIFLLLASFVERMASRSDKANPESTLWRKDWTCAALVVVIGLAAKVWLIGQYVVPTNSAAPEIPAESRILVSKITRTFAAGDMIAYRNDGNTYVGRVVDPRDDGVMVSRNGQPNDVVPYSRVVGRVISVYWRGTGSAPASADATPPVAPTTYREVVLKKFTSNDKPLSSKLKWTTLEDGTTALQLDSGEYAQMEREMKTLEDEHADNGKVNELRRKMQSFVHRGGETSYRFVEIERPDVADCTLVFRGKITTRTGGIGAAFSISCRYQDRSQESSGKANERVWGETDWVSCAAPVTLDSASKPDLVRLFCDLNGEGEAYARDLELVALYPQTP